MSGRSFPRGRLLRRSTRRTNAWLTGRYPWTVTVAVIGAAIGGSLLTLTTSPPPWLLVAAPVFGVLVGSVLLGGLVFGWDLLRYVRSGYRAEGWTPYHQRLDGGLWVQLNRKSGQSDLSLECAECWVRTPAGLVRELEHGSGIVQRRIVAASTEPGAVAEPGRYEVRWYRNDARGSNIEWARDFFLLPAPEAEAPSQESPASPPGQGEEPT